MDETLRYVWLDYVKSIVILLVVLFHSNAVTYEVASSFLAMGVMNCQGSDVGQAYDGNTRQLLFISR